MNIEAYIIAWNEIEIIELTIKHYQKFCSKVFLFDNYSDDGTFEKAQEMGCQVARFGIKGQLDDTEYLKIKNQAWKGSKADFVIVVDADEIIYHPNIINVFLDASFKEATVIPAEGYNMVSHEMPKDDFLEITTGSINTSYSKVAIFNPKFIKEINYRYGCHVANPHGRVKIHGENVFLLHYRAIGGPDRLVKKHEIYRKRMSKKNLKFKLGIHYLWKDDRRIKEWNELYESSSKMDKVLFNRAF
jgi:glycosyltransferase involved in cell wall biosynthesis